MKSCPTCQQLYSDALEVCPTDGSTLLNSSLGYSPGGSSQGYKWQSGQVPPTQAYWQQQQQQPPPGWGYYPPPGSYPPPGAYPPPYGYGMPYAPPQGGGGLGTAALWTGISTMGCLVFGFFMILAGASSYASSVANDPSYYRSGPPGSVVFGIILVFLSYIVGLTALILGIVATSMASRNPNINKAKSVTGLCLGAAPYVLWFILLLAGTSMMPRRW